MMEFDQLAFIKYLEELRIHLFEDDSIDEIINNIHNSHRARRFFTMYLIRDCETFHYYYRIREQLGIGFIFDTVIAALFHEQEKKPAKIALVDILQVNLNMANQRVEGYPLKEFDKDLNTFRAYWLKKTGRLQYLYENLSD